MGYSNIDLLACALKAKSVRGYNSKGTYKEVTSSTAKKKFFLEKMGIIERVRIIEKRMNVKEKNYMSQTLARLLDEKLMGKLFKVIFAFKSKRENFLGFN